MDKERLNQIIKEDLLLFINACCTCTVQKEFYTNRYEQKMSLDFLHEYMLINYRTYYMRILAVNINQFNKTIIILNLLSNGKSTPPQLRFEENRLITSALYKLPANRVYKLFQKIRQSGINNRRTRAIVKNYLNNRKDLSFDIVKYRKKINSAVAHNHIKLDGEANDFLFSGYKSGRFKTELFESFRQAHFSKEAVYKLPYTVAEGFVKKHKINRSIFLDKIKSKMTLNEKLRSQELGNKKNIKIKIDLSKASLTKIALYALSLPYSRRKERLDELDNALNKAAKRIISKWNLGLGKVAAVLDCSYSMSGSSEKKRRPLAITLAGHYLLKNASSEYKAFWTTDVKKSLLLQAKGQSDLNTPFLDALEWKPEKIIILSDGYDNSFWRISDIIRIFKTKIEKRKRTGVVHFNPVFDAHELEPRRISDLVPTIGLRDSEDIPSLLPFADLGEYKESLSKLENFLNYCKERLMKQVLI
ncbi:MAG: hypothetical protein GY714_28220 [Desulfobacterales bacterium]|nr:hypothetical protein [Desulfobacterales bacterium]MCP4161861.1 hypothetical protein [Deltaproteobacteria bacterium]